ncbi:tryptophan 7-halogenase [Sphingomonas phyllosphaerae]|uniref:tryptophan 7-halogenase n=1 Tax=Sphingomonas phyllosphaerae TaxID=257003 RepID=UPI0032217F4C
MTHADAEKPRGPAERLRSIIIVGGGTAGWMTAALLARRLAPFGIALTLIESSAIGTIGVGEATTPAIRDYFEAAGLDEGAVMRAAEGTAKLGIAFEGSVKPNAPAPRVAGGLCIVGCFSTILRLSVLRTLSSWFRECLRSPAIEQANGVKIRLPRAGSGCFDNIIFGIGHSTSASRCPSTSRTARTNPRHPLEVHHCGSRCSRHAKSFPSTEIVPLSVRLALRMTRQANPLQVRAPLRCTPKPPFRYPARSSQPDIWAESLDASDADMNE